MNVFLSELAKAYPEDYILLILDNARRAAPLTPRARRPILSWKRFRNIGTHKGRIMRIVTIRDVAREAQVSITTVSRVLNDRLDVDEQTRRRVLGVVERLHYVRNANASNLKQRHTDFAAVVLRGRRNTFLTDLAELILEKGHQTGLRFLMEIIDEKADEFDTARALYQERKLKGVVFLGSNLCGREKDIENLDLPCVFATVEAAFLAGRSLSSVSIDNFASGKAAAEHLLGLGHRKIALLGYFGPKTDSTGQRLYGAAEALEKYGIARDSDLFEECDFTLADGYRGMQAVLARRKDFTAVFAVSDIIALGALKALSDQGLNVPGDISLIGFDGIEQAAYSLPSLTTLRQPAGRIAEETIALLSSLLRGEKGRHILLPAELVPGASVRAL